MVEPIKTSKRTLLEDFCPKCGTFLTTTYNKNILKIFCNNCKYIVYKGPKNDIERNDRSVNSNSR